MTVEGQLTRVNTNFSMQMKLLPTFIEFNLYLQVPAATLQVFNVIFIILTLPLMQKLYRFLASRGIYLSVWKRMAIGMILASLALAAGGLLELLRLDDIIRCGFHRQSIGKVVILFVVTVFLCYLQLC